MEKDTLLYNEYGGAVCTKILALIHLPIDETTGMNKTEHDKKTLAYFQEIARIKRGFYDTDLQIATQVQKWVRDTVITLIVPQTSSILDAGCGCGDFSQILLERFPDATICGVDFSQDMIARARQKFQHEQLSFQESFLTQIQYENSSFETVVCINTLHHLRPQDLPLVLKELCRVAKKQVIVEVKNNLSPYHAIKKLKMSKQTGLEIFGTNYFSMKRIFATNRCQIVRTRSLLKSGILLAPVLCILAEKR